MFLNNLTSGGSQDIVWKTVFLEGLENSVWTEVQEKGKEMVG